MRIQLTAAWVELAAGLAIAAAGIADTVWSLPAELAEVRPSANQSISLIGLLLVLRSIGEIAHNLHDAGECAPGESCDLPAQRFWSRFRRTLASRPMRWVAGTLIILGGFGEALQAYQGVATAGHVYQWGVVLVGFMIIGRAGHQLHEGMELIHRAGPPAWLKPIEAFFEHPVVHLAMALALCVLAGAEVLYPDATPGQADGPAVHGLALIGSISLMRAAKDLMHGARLAWHLRRTERVE